jgi:hypothetical protein
MSRIFNLFFLPKSFTFQNKVDTFFYRDRSLLLNKKKYIYYDYFFFLINYDLSNYNLNLLIFKNFKNFINFFYHLNVVGKKFIVFDYNYQFSLIFKNLIFSDFTLIKYNSFFKFNLTRLKNQSFFFFFKQFIDSNSVELVILLDYEMFHLYSSLFNLLNICSFAFVKPNYTNLYLDFFLIKSSTMYFLQKIVFFSNLYKIYALSIDYRSLFLYNQFLKNLSKHNIHLA